VEKQMSGRMLQPEATDHCRRTPSKLALSITGAVSIV
jgi:hypothetical protein